MPLNLEKFSQEKNFVGIDTYNAPNKLAPGFLQQADNLFVVGGNLVTRPGIQGKLSSVMGGSIYELTPFQASDGTTTLVFACLGKLYKWLVGGGAPTEIIDASTSASFAFPSNGKFVRMARYGKYLYGVPGPGGGAIFRTDLTSGGSSSYSGLSTPTAGMTAVLTSTTIEDTSDYTKWAGIPSPSSTSNLTTDPSLEIGTFHSGSGGYLNPLTDWPTVSGQPDCVSSTFNSIQCVPYDGNYTLLLDVYGDSVHQQVGSLPTIDLTTPFGLTSITARIFTFQGFVHQADNTARSTIDIQLTAQSSGGTIDLDTRSGSISQSYQSSLTAWTPHMVTANFMALPTDPDRIDVQMTGGQFNNPGTHSTYIDYVTLQASDVHLVATAAAGSQITASVAGTAIPGSEPYIGYQWLRRGYTTAKDFSGSNILSCAISLPAGVLNAAGDKPRFRFGFTKAGDTAISWSNTCVYSDDGQFISADCTTVPVATRAATTGFFIQILDDIPGLTAGAPVFTFGPITGAGNLSVATNGVNVADYIWIFTEITSPNISNSADVIESSGSPVSNTVTPTNQQAQVDLTLPSGAPYNAVTDHYAIYRLGGTLASDGSFRLVAIVPKNADTPITGQGAAYVTWNHTTKVFHDNTPDSELLFQPTLYQVNRDSFPSGGQSLCVSNGRLFVSVGNTVYVSWLLKSGLESALYTSLQTDLVSDPSVAVKGGTYPLDSDSLYDSIVDMKPLETAVFVARQNSFGLLNGYDPTNFAYTGQYANAGLGCLALRSLDVEHNQVTFLSASGLISYNIQEATPASIPLEGVLNPDPNSGGATITPAAYAACVSVYHNRRRFLFAPIPGGSANTVAYVYDTRTNGYTRWTSIPAASACSLSSESDAQYLYIGGTDGQIYQVTGAVDKALPASSGTPITFTLLTRAFGQEGEGWEYFYEDRVNRLFYHISTGATSVSLTLSATGNSNPSLAFTTSIVTKATAGETQAQARCANFLRGGNFTMGLTGATSAQFTIVSLGVYHVEGQRLR